MDALEVALDALVVKVDVRLLVKGHAAEDVRDVQELVIVPVDKMVVLVAQDVQEPVLPLVDKMVVLVAQDVQEPVPIPADKMVVLVAQDVQDARGNAVELVIQDVLVKLILQLIWL